MESSHASFVLSFMRVHVMCFLSDCCLVGVDDLKINYVSSVSYHFSLHFISTKYEKVELSESFQSPTSTPIALHYSQVF